MRTMCENISVPTQGFGSGENRMVELQRTLMSSLLAWKQSRNRKPLLLRGARQTGKTWIMNEFARQNYAKMARIDFMANERSHAFFDNDFDINRILQALAIETGVDITPRDTLVVFDEIQECPRALESLKYWQENAPSYHVAATGSYMGMAIHQQVSYPVGKVDSLVLHPLTFFEFLTGMGQTSLSKLIESGNLDAIDPAFYGKLEALLKEYMFVGGMPGVVADYVEHHDVKEARRIQHGILSDYDADFSKHAPARLLERLRLTWASLPAQLAKENRKFVYGVVRPGARARDFEECLQWLCDYGIARRVPCLSSIRLPLAGYASESIFKMFALDTGLLAAMSDLDAEVLISGSELFKEFKGALTEQYVAQELVAQELNPYYWASPRGSAEVDFVVSLGGHPMPIEVKSGTNTRSKSLRVACDKFHLAHAVRASLKGYSVEDWVTNIPLWAIGSVSRL